MWISQETWQNPLRLNDSVAGRDTCVGQEVIVKGQSLSYQVKFNRRRKTRSLIKLLPDGCVLVDVPVTANLLQVQHWVAERAEWLLRRRAEIEQGQGFIQRPSYVEDEAHPFLGKSYRLKFFDAKDVSRQEGIAGEVLWLGVAESDVKGVQARLWRWYCGQASSLFQRRMTALSEAIEWVDAVPVLKLRKMRRRWGSCTSLGVITLNTHLVKAPLACIDYVILHEICHLREHNHSHRFYQLLDQALPGWRELKRVLDEQSEIISNE